MKDPLAIINNSGYPLQIHLEEFIKKNNPHGWRVLTKEHRWINVETQEEGFIDLILERSKMNVRLVVECKKVDGVWSFLLPKTDNLYIRSETKSLITDLTNRKIYWANIRLLPKSYISTYCVPEVQGKKDTRTLEKIAGELILSCEALAREEEPLSIGFSDGYYLYVPVIVTTAELNSLVFDPFTVDIKSGKISNTTPDPSEFIRFQKNFATSVPAQKSSQFPSIKSVNEENDRTVFVVQSQKFLDFLENFSIVG